MKKISTKKMLTVLISLAMVFSALAVISMAAQPAYAASGTITADPTVFTETGGALASTIVVFNGGTFGAGASITFWLSTTNTFTMTGSYSGGYSGAGPTRVIYGRFDAPLVDQTLQ